MSTKTPILSVYDENGNRIEIPAIKGGKGRSINKSTRTVNLTRLGVGGDRSYTY